MRSGLGKRLVTALDGVEVNFDAQHRTLKMSCARPSTIRKDPKHRVVLCEHIGYEVMESVSPRHFAEPAQQCGTDAAKMLTVSDDYRHLGVSGVFTSEVVCDSEQFLGIECAKGALTFPTFGYGPRPSL